MCKVSVIVPVYNVENYIENMLLSVQQQTFKDFEVILVNDGSTDRSQDVIDRFCNADKRFKCFIKENGGVASARNLGIEKACGKYVVFYDPDDYIPADSLSKMYKAANKSNADMIVGIMEEKSLGESLIYMHSQKLASQKNISPLDEHFVGAWSLCHKMFSLDFIKKNGLKVEKMSNAEDGVFTFSALNFAEKICGCNAVAYNYIKRPFWLTPSATQIISNKYLDGLLDSHARILEEATKLADKYLTEDEKNRYLQPLYVRFIEGEMINGYYRGIWRAEEDLIPRIEKRTEAYKQYITEEQWKKLLNNHRDISLAEGFKSLSELAANPKVSIIVSANVDQTELNTMLGSIYNQLFPMFEVMLPKCKRDLIEETYKQKANIVVVEDNDFVNEASGLAKGEYILFFNEFGMFTKQSLKQMVLKLVDDKSLDFVTMLVKRRNGEDYEQIDCISAAYGYTKKSKRKYDELTKCDGLLFNKLFRKEALEGFEFSDNTAEDVDKLYRSLNFEKMRKGVMITDLSNEDILSKSNYSISNRKIRAAYSRNERIRVNSERLKRYITREDIERFKRLIGR